MDAPSPLLPELEALSSVLIDSAFKVHQTLGPGLLESVYKACLCIELGKRGIFYETEVPIPLVYEGISTGTGLRLDLLVERSLIVEIKSLEQLLPIHKSQLLSYLRLADLRLGLLINFNVALFKQGVKRIIR
jgi:GxxExxY protein